MVSHVGLMTLYAFILSFFLTLLWRRTRRRQIKLFLQLFLSLMGGGLLLAWLMYFFPAGPPAPIP